MIKKRHFYIVIGILLAGFIVGSFLDLQINQALYSQGNMYGVIMAAFGTYPCYAGLSFTAGGLLITSLKKKDLHIVWRIISWFLVALGYGLSVYLGSKDVPSVNGFDNKQLLLPTMAINVFIFAGFGALGFLVCKKGDMNTLWIDRFVVNSGTVGFCNWWETCKDYKNYINGDLELYGHVITKEEFKSFPSGHSGSAAIMMMVLPYLSMFFKKLKGKETMMFYIGFAWTLLMMFSRMLVGAHFLTDTCMGALIVVVVVYIGHEIATRKGLIYKDEYHPQQQEAVQQ